MSKSKLGKSRSKISVEKQRNSILGSNNPFFGKSHSESFRKKQSERQKLNQAGGKNNNAIMIKYKDTVFETIKNMSSSTGISYYNIKKMIANKEVEML